MQRCGIYLVVSLRKVNVLADGQTGRRAGGQTKTGENSYSMDGSQPHFWTATAKTPLEIERTGRYGWLLRLHKLVFPPYQWARVSQLQGIFEVKVGAEAGRLLQCRNEIGTLRRPHSFFGAEEERSIEFLAEVIPPCFLTSFFSFSLSPLSFLPFPALSRFSRSFRSTRSATEDSVAVHKYWTVHCVA